MAAYQIIPITREQVQKIITWKYQSPYHIYDLGSEDLMGLLTPEYRYHHVLDQEDELVGYCCYGIDAQVPGGDYSAGEPEMLDVGVGMRPDLTGQGRGVGFVGAVLNYGAIIYRPKTFRATIAGFNQRSLRTFQGLGFEVKEEFIREMSDIHFLILEKMIKEEQDGGTSKTANP